jgi:hypothetical protein
MAPHVIALYSSAPGAGKSTVARHLCDKHLYTRLSFADPIKRVVETFLIELGYDHSGTYSLLHGSLKEVTLPEIGTTSRHLMRTLGTEWGRQCVHPDVWVTIADKHISRALSEGRNVVIDDLRYPNEYNLLVNKYNATIWHITRDPHTKDSTHASDGALEDKFFTGYINNNSTIAELLYYVDLLLLPLTCSTKRPPEPDDRNRNTFGTITNVMHNRHDTH